MNVLDDRIIDFVGRYIEENGYSPSIRDIMDGLDLNSTDTIHRRLRIMQRQGRINWQANQSRTLRIVSA